MTIRCDWANGSALGTSYHDTEWGVPSRDDRHLFEMLVLEGAQAGLSWDIVLRKREGYRRAFAGFDPAQVARFDRRRRERLLRDPGLIRNRLKIEAAVVNARMLIEVAEERGSFAAYLWEFVDGRPIRNTWRSMRQVPAETALSRTLGKDLARRGFRFVGPTICYAYMQAVGLVNDHIVRCFRYAAV